MDFLQKHHAIFVNVDAPESDHFMVMPSDVDEDDEFECRISSTAWTQREGLYHRQNSGCAFRLRLQPRMKSRKSLSAAGSWREKRVKCMSFLTITISITRRARRFVCARHSVKSSRPHRRQQNCFNLTKFVSEHRIIDKKNAQRPMLRSDHYCCTRIENTPSVRYRFSALGVRRFFAKLNQY